MNKSLLDLKEGDKVFCGKINFNTLEFNIGETIVLKTIDYATFGHRIIYVDDIPKGDYPFAFTIVYKEKTPKTYLSYGLHVISLSREQVKKALLKFADGEINCHTVIEKRQLEDIKKIQSKISEIKKRKNSLIALKLMVNKH